MKVAGGLAYVALLLLAGCHRGIEVGRAEKMSPEMVGIKLEVIGQFSADGVLAGDGDQLGKAYADQGFLEYRVFRLTNITEEEVALFLGANVRGADAALTLKQKFFTGCPRSMDPARPEGTRPAQDHFTVYTSEFDRMDSRLVFASGGVEVLPEIREDSDILQFTPSRLRPGESAEYRIRVRLKSESPLLESLPLPAGVSMTPGSFLFFPPDRTAVSESNRIWVAEQLCRFTVSLGIEPDFVLQNPDDHSLHPLYLGAAHSLAHPRELVRKPYTIDGLEIPDAALPFQRHGLPILIP